MSKENNNRYILGIVDGFTVIARIISETEIPGTYKVTNPFTVIENIIGFAEGTDKNGNKTMYEVSPKDPQAKQFRINVEVVPYIFPETLEKYDDNEWTWTPSKLYRIIDKTDCALVKCYEAQLKIRSTVTLEKTNG